MAYTTLKVFISGSDLMHNCNMLRIARIQEVEESLKEQGYEILNPIKDISPSPVHGLHPKIYDSFLISKSDKVVVIENWAGCLDSKVDILFAQLHGVPVESFDTKKRLSVAVELKLEMK